MRRTPTLAAMLVIAAMTAAGPALADDSGPTARLTYTIDGPALEHGVPSVVEVVAVPGGTVSVASGSRLPIPTRAAPDEGSDGDHDVRYSYQHVGLSIQARTRTAEGGRLLVSGNLEVSGLAAGPAPADAGSPPVVTTSSSSFAVTLADGASERIVRVSGIDGDRLVVELRLDVLE